MVKAQEISFLYEAVPLAWVTTRYTVRPKMLQQIRVTSEGTLLTQVPFSFQINENLCLSCYVPTPTMRIKLSPERFSLDIVTY